MITCPPASIISAPRNCLRIASSVSTATMSVPSIATAPFSMTRFAASMVTTMPLWTSSDTCRGGCWAATAAPNSQEDGNESGAHPGILSKNSEERPRVA